MLCYILTCVYISTFVETCVTIVLGHSLGEIGIQRGASHVGNLGWFGNVSSCSNTSSFFAFQIIKLDINM